MRRQKNSLLTYPIHLPGIAHQYVWPFTGNPLLPTEPRPARNFMLRGNPKPFPHGPYGNLTGNHKTLARHAHDLPFEFMLNALRLVEGFPVHRFVERTGLSMTSIEPALKDAERRGLITRDHERIAPTVLGQRFLNDLQGLFLRDAE